MTRDETVTRVRINLDDEGITYYSAADCIDSIQDGYDEAVALIRPFESSKTIDFVSQLTYYNLYELISNYIHVIAIYNNNTERWLDFISIRDLEAWDEKWEIRDGNPEFFTVLDFQYIALYPRLTTATGNMDILYKVKACTLDGSTEMRLTTVDRNIVENYSTTDLLEQSEEFAKAQRYQNSYFESIKNAKEFVARRHLNDIVYQLRAQMPVRN